MPQELDTTTIAMILFAGLVAHVVLVAVSKLINPMVLLAGFFMLLTPLAVAEISGQSAAKWARVYATLLMFVVGLFYSKHYKIGPALGVYLFFVLVYFMGSVWSDKMFQAMKFKGLFLALVLAGGYLAYSIRSETDLRRGLRFFVVIGGLIATIMLTDFVRNPAAISSVGRFEPWGLVATRVGAICGPLGLVCAFIALYDKAKFWKIIAYGVGGALCLNIIYSGSRGGLFMAGIGCFVIGLPVIKRPVLAASVLIGAALVAYAVTELAGAGNSEATERLTEVNFESRAQKWIEARERFAENPIFGSGWEYDTSKRESGSTANMHSLYLQVAVELGFFGLLIFGASVMVIVSRAIWVLRQSKRRHAHVEITYFAVGLGTAIMAYGIAESAMLTGGTVVGMLLPFSIGLIDRISEFTHEEMLLSGDDGEGEWEYWEHDEDGDHDPDAHDGWDDEHGHAYHDEHEWDEHQHAAGEYTDGY